MSLIHFFEIEHLNEFCQNINHRFSCVITNLSLSHHNQKLNFSYFAENALQKIRNSNYSNEISRVLESCHISQRYTLPKTFQDIWSQSH